MKTSDKKNKQQLSMVTALSGGKLKAPKFEIEIMDQNTDLEVTIEGSNHLYGATIQIKPEEDEDHDDVFSRDGTDRGMTSLIDRIYGDRYAL